MIERYRNDPYFLARYYLAATLLTPVAIGVLYRGDFRPSIAVWLVVMLPLFASSFLGGVTAFAGAVGLMLAFHRHEIAPWHFLLVPLGVYFGMLSVPLIHNAAHANFRPRALNRPLGELLSLHLLSGFPGFVILHLMHHRHADDPEKDPHPNHGLTYWGFLNGLKISLRAAFRRLHAEHWKDDERAARALRFVGVALPLNRVLRALLILVVFGPVGFTFFYVPSFLANQLTYAHINYFSHVEQPDGSVRIVNLDHGVYRWLNRLLFGIYFHGNHHRHCSRFNPAVPR